MFCDHFFYFFYQAFCGLRVITTILNMFNLQNDFGLQNSIKIFQNMLANEKQKNHKTINAKICLWLI
jgi:hypothetical protein